MPVRLAPLAALLVLAGCQAAGPQAVAPTPGVDVTAYGAAVRLDPATRHVEGRVEIRLRHPRALRHATFALDRAMEVRSVRVDGRPAGFTHGPGALVVQFPTESEEGVVEILYGGVPADGLYAETAAGQRVVYTDAWPQRGAGWLPAVHHPSDPALLALAVEVPAGWSVAATGTAAPPTAAAGGYRRWTFTLDRSAPAYTFAFAAARFTFVDDTTGSIPVRHALLEADAGRAALLARMPAVLDTLQAVLGPYPYGTFTTVEVPLGYAGMEDAGAPFLQAALYRRPGNQVEDVAIHEAAHQWLGNRLVPDDWRDLWLSEGAATYLTTVVYERLDGAAAARRARLDMARMDPADAALPLAPEHLDRPVDALGPTVYNKGGSVMHLLRLTVGDRAFFGALRRLVAHARPTSTATFRRVLEQESGQDLGPFFAYWVQGRRVPTLATRWDAATRTLTWRVTGDEGTLHGVPFELRVTQVGGTERYVDARAGRVTLPGDRAPVVVPVGVVVRVEE